MEVFEPRTAAGEAAFARLAERPSEVLVAVDYDGTLAPIVDDPTRAHPHPAGLAALARLGRLVGNTAIITGRPARTVVDLAGLDRVPGLERLIVLGQYGVERWDALTGRFEVPPAPPAIAEVLRELPAVLALAGYPDVLVEDKGRAIGVHTRQQPDPQAAFEALAGPVGELAARHRLQVEPGRFVLEIRSAAMDKGRALRELVAETGARTIVFAGDDLGDLLAFEVVGELVAAGLFGVRVYSASAEQTGLGEMADVWCQGPSGVAAWLGAAADAIVARA